MSGASGQKTQVDSKSTRVATPRGPNCGSDPEAQQPRLGYLKALAESGIEPDTRLVTQVEFELESSEAAISRLLRRGVSFDGVVAASDLIALGRAGLSVPADVSVAADRHCASVDRSGTIAPTGPFPLPSSVLRCSPTSSLDGRVMSKSSAEPALRSPAEAHNPGYR